MLEREHFIRFRKTAIFQMCLEDGRLDASQQREFREFATILDALFHYEYHARLEVLKDSYAPFDPDRDTRMTREECSAEHRAAAHEQFARTLQQILEKANYRRISRAEIDEALVQLDMGIYGLCEQCGKPIEPERLAVLSHTTVCSKCAQRRR